MRRIYTHQSYNFSQPYFLARYIRNQILLKFNSNFLPYFFPTNSSPHPPNLKLAKSSFPTMLDQSAYQESSDQDKNQEISAVKAGFEEIEEGYQTPTSEEHRIPPVCLDRPPPAPKKRVFEERRNSSRKVRRRLFFEDRELKSLLAVADLVVSFSSMAAPPPPPPPPSVPEPDAAMRAEYQSQEDTF